MTTLTVTIPALGRNGVAVRLARWCKTVGDRVRDEEPIGFLQVGEEVFLAEIPSPGSGVLGALHAVPGDPVRAGQVVAHVHAELPDVAHSEFGVALPPATTTPTEVQPVARAVTAGGVATGPWPSLAMASICLLSVLLITRRPDDPLFATVASLGLVFFALPAWATHLRHSGQTPGWALAGLPHGRLWTVVTFLMAASLPVGLALTQPLATWLAREGRTSADVLNDVFPALVAVIGCSFFAVSRLKPRGLAIVGLAATGAALIVLSSTRPLTSEALVMVAAFVAWPVLTFAEHDRHAQFRHEGLGDAAVLSISMPPVGRAVSASAATATASNANRGPLIVQHVR